MNWKYKALLQGVFSRVPGGEHLNYFCQRHVTRSLPINASEFAKCSSYARDHINLIHQHLDLAVERAVFYEFGAGWDLLGPITFWALGVEHQILVDIRKLFRSDLANDVIAQFQDVPLDFPILRKPTRRIQEGRGAIFSLKENYGIEYKAPSDARSTDLEDASVDCITSTSTLEHIPPKDIQAILAECHRILKNGGVMSFITSYEDHYSFFDQSISVYNFLGYSDRTWAIFNPGLHYQNRLRHRDYLRLVQAAGFLVVDETRRQGTAADLEALKGIPLSKAFRNYSPEELAVRSSHLVLVKRV